MNECHRCSVEHDDPLLDREIELQVRRLVGELLKYGGSRDEVFCKIVNDWLVRHLESGGVLHEGQAGFRVKRSCIYVLSESEDCGRERRLMHSF